MTLQDIYNNPISTRSTQAQSAYNTGLYLFLGSNFGAVENFTTAIDADPGFALGHAGLARAYMMSGDMAAAKSAIARAQTLTGGLTAREKAHVHTFATLLSGDPVKTRALVEDHMRDYPRDALIAQLCTSVFGLIGFSGETGREAALLAFTQSLLPHYGEDWWMMGIHAVSLCETGQHDAALTLMERALAIEPRNANGAHFKAHAQYEAGDTAGGRAYLASWMPGYNDRALLHGHLSWHQALWALAEGDEDTLWHVVDTAVGPGAAKGLPLNVLTDTAAILHRAALAGFTVDQTRWSRISDYAAQFFPDAGQSFADLHAALSHAMAGEGDRLAKLAETSRGFAADLVRPAATAFGAMARGDWTTALEDLTPVMAGHERFGGSRAQRDLLELTYVSLLLRLNRPDEARRTLAMRRPVQATSPPLASLH